MHWILYCIKDDVLYFFISLEQPLNIYGLHIELFFKSYTAGTVKVLNSSLQDDILRVWWLEIILLTILNLDLVRIKNVTIHNNFAIDIFVEEFFIKPHEYLL